MDTQTTAAPVLEYYQRKALQRYDRFVAMRLPHLAFGYHAQLSAMRRDEAVRPLDLFEDPTTQAAQAAVEALQFALREDKAATKAALQRFRAELAEVRFREEFFNPEGFFELLYKPDAYTTEDDRGGLEGALKWYNTKRLDREDSFVVNENGVKTVYPRLVVLYTYLEVRPDGSTHLESIHVAERHARQERPRQLTKLPVAVADEINALEADQARAEQYNPR